MDAKRLTLSIDSNLTDVALVGLSVNKICSQIPLSDVETYQIEACVVEAITNTIKHAYLGHSGNQVDVKVALTLDRIVFKVCDTGNPLEKEVSPSLEFDPDDLENLPEGGMGLFIINQVMDHVAYDSSNGVNTLEMAKIFGTRPESKPA